MSSNRSHCRPSSGWFVVVCVCLSAWVIPVLFWTWRVREAAAVLVSFAIGIHVLWLGLKLHLYVESQLGS